MAKPTPLKIVKDKHGSKAELVDKVVELVEPMEGESSDEHKRRLRNTSNAKLLHLLDLGEKVKEAGGRDGLVKAILESKKQTKDHEYADSLERLPLGKLYDLAQTAKRRAKKSA